MYDTSRFYQKPQYPGQAMVPANQPIKAQQPLSAAEIEMLRSTINEANWSLSEIDLLKAKCTHKDKNGVYCLVDLPNNRVRCTICGEEFSIITDDLTVIQEHVDYVINALQTIKTIYFDAPNALSENYFQTIPMLKKTSLIFSKATDSFANHSNAFQTMGGVYGTQFGMAPDAFQTMNNMMAGNSFGQDMYTPVPGVYNNNQFIPQQPAPQAPAYGYQYNPFTGGMMPATQQPAQIPDPGQVAQQPAPQVPVPPVQQPASQQGQVTQTKTFNV